MSVEIVATPASATANSYCTEEEATAYFDSRLPLPTPWDDVDDQTAALAMATRLLDAMSQGRRELRTIDGKSYYVTSRKWTGTPATSTQRLAWPRIGMVDANGNAIAADVIPIDLKNAEAELAGQLNISDTTLDNAADVGGIKQVDAGSVSVVFKDFIAKHVLPDAVMNLMPASWFTDEIYEPALLALFDVVSN